MHTRKLNIIPSSGTTLKNEEHFFLPLMWVIFSFAIPSFLLWIANKQISFVSLVFVFLFSTVFSVVLFGIDACLILLRKPRCDSIKIHKHYISFIKKGVGKKYEKNELISCKAYMYGVPSGPGTSPPMYAILKFCLTDGMNYYCDVSVSDLKKLL